MALMRLRPPALSRALDAISPSLAARLEVCPLAVVFSRDEAYHGFSRRGSHFATLGEICHSLWEREARGDFDDLADDALNVALNTGWDKVERANLHQLRESLDGVQPPPPQQWPGYLVKRLGTLGLIKRSVQARHQKPEHSGKGFRPSVEEQIELSDLPLRGRPDRVVWRDGTAHIIDLKTCASGSSMRLEHRRQLLAYAYLFYAKNDIWPATATIQYVGGESRTFEIDPTEAETVVRKMLEALGRLNHFDGDPEELAQPSEEACRWCQFKAACAPFYSALNETWNFPDRHVLGTVVEVDASRPRRALTLEVRQGNIPERSVVVIAPDARMLEGIRVGDLVAIAGATATRSPKTIRCIWDSVVCVWKEPSAGVLSSESA
jgi:CRISPR/Cas system-associated exonuclease Cas4 (RecB family)